MTTPTIHDPYTAFSRLKALAEDTHTAHGRKQLANSMKLIARFCDDTAHREAMLAIARELENLPLAVESEGKQ